MPSSTPGATREARRNPEAGPGAGAILRTVDLVKTFRGRTAVAGVSLTVGAGEVVGLLGPNGAGKTTTFYMALGLLHPDRGQVFLNGEEVTALPVYQRARRGLGFLPQEPSIFRKLTVEENVLAILEGVPLSAAARRERALALLAELGIAHLAARKAYTLSGGERRRAEISRCLATDPACILMDEPFAGIDPIAVQEIQGIIAQLKAKGIGILITDHNVRETLQIVDRADIIHRGEILISGTARELAADERARALYLGERFRL